METILSRLDEAAVEIYDAVRAGLGLRSAQSSNTAGDEQLELDLLADRAFRTRLANEPEIRFVISEEQPDLARYSDGPFSVALDPLDGSKSALVGIPCGAIFGIFKDVEDVTGFNGSALVAAGFYVFGATLECYYAIDRKVYQKIYQTGEGAWEISSVEGSFPAADFFAINVSNFKYWPKWLQNYYSSIVFDVKDDKKPSNIRWYASMVSEVKRLLIQGGVFAYPNDSRPSYGSGHLRLVYEAIPMAYVVESLGGASSNGDQSLLSIAPSALHQKTSVFLGEAEKIADLENAKNNLTGV